MKNGANQHVREPAIGRARRPCHVQRSDRWLGGDGAFPLCSAPTTWRPPRPHSSTASPNRFRAFPAVRRAGTRSRAAVVRRPGSTSHAHHSTPIHGSLFPALRSRPSLHPGAVASTHMLGIRSAIPPQSTPAWVSERHCALVDACTPEFAVPSRSSLSHMPGFRRPPFVGVVFGGLHCH